MSRVVVGFDNSAHSVEALRVAADEARWRSVPLHVVYIYEPAQTGEQALAGVIAGDTSMAEKTSGQMLDEAQHRGSAGSQEARRHAEGVLRQMLQKTNVDLSAVELEASVIADEHPAAGLVRLSQDADLLVVGHRGRGGFRGLLLGSVGQHCMRHAACSVLIVRPSTTSTETNDGQRTQR
jgi:nucleotide-binding universal stress UspA family protein